ncbi:SMI1/KNR4 family protein [Bacillus sp. BP-3]|uniref:SMI1/KNR4 family protein n=1 Tax=Bacillus sp. BP-3 TaxID=3022773 RepID=UPI003FA4621F
MRQLIAQIESLSDCRVLEPAGLPIINEKKHSLPEDVKEFYSLCGGMVLFENEEYSVYIVSPQELILANPVIISELCEDDMSSNWYIICNGRQEEYVTIDLHQNRLGKCYDSFFDRHGVVGESQIIATSFIDLLERLIHYKGKYWYWLQSDFVSLGDAYDGLI